MRGKPRIYQCVCGTLTATSMVICPRCWTFTVFQWLPWKSKEKNMRRLTLALVLLSAVAGCTSGNQAAISAWGQPHHIKQFSGGLVIGEWDSVGKINETESDGYYFQDAKTGLLVSLSGTVQITIKGK